MVSTRVLATKLFVPVRRARLVARSRIVERLDAALEPDCRLTLLSAPAGFGKTTVAGDWIAGLRDREPRPGIGWVSLDDGDNDPALFLAYVAAALRNARPRPARP